MSGGKTNMGTLDSQDYILRRPNRNDEPGDTPNWEERERAVRVCALAKEWGLDGVIRMEAGFEIIQCDFANGLDQVQALQRPGSNGNGPGRGGSMGSFEFIRGLAERYFDIGSSRTIVDYSSMVSAYFFPFNLTNPDAKRPDLPRLINATETEVNALQAYLNRTISARLADPVRTIDWRDVTDIIVGRYADRIKYMAEKTSTLSEIVDVLNFLLTTFIDFSGKDESDLVAPAVERCTDFYLHSIKPVTEPDQFIHAAIRTVTSEICTRLFDVRELASKNNVGGLDEVDVMTTAVSILQNLMEYLSWARFKRCSACEVNEVCLIPMWPMGSKASYESPHCVNSTHMDDGESYWGHFGPGRGGRGGKGGKGGNGPRL